MMEQLSVGAELLLMVSILTPVIVGLIEASKQLFSMPKNIVPMVAVAVGLFVGFVAAPLVDMDWTLRLWAGALAGLASTGLYEVQTKRDGQTRA